MQSLPPGSLVYVAGSPWFYANHGPSRYLGDAVERRDLRNPTADLPIERDGRPLTIIINPALDTWLPLIQRYYPEARPITIERPAGQPVLTALEIPPDMQAVSQPPERGLRGTITTRGEHAATHERHDPAIVFHELRSVARADSYTGAWEGWLLVEQAGEHELELFTDGAARLTLDDQIVIAGEATPERPRPLRQTLQLTARRHRLHLEADWERGVVGYLSFSWRPPGEEWRIVEPEALQPPLSNDQAPRP